jgi:hypothetical protein
VNRARPSLDNTLFLYRGALNSYLRELGIEDIGWPGKSDILDISSLASQWRETRSSTWLGISPFDLDKREWAFMKCLPVGMDRLVGTCCSPSSEFELLISSCFKYCT